MSEGFSGNLDVMRLLTYEPRLCTLHELYTVYDLDDFYDLLEIVDVQEALKDIVKDKEPVPKPQGKVK